MESLHSNYSDTTDLDYSDTCPISRNLLNGCGSRKVFIMAVCVLLTVFTVYTIILVSLFTKLSELLSYDGSL